MLKKAEQENGEKETLVDDLSAEIGEEEDTSDDSNFDPFKQDDNGNGQEGSQQKAKAPPARSRNYLVEKPSTSEEKPGSPVILSESSLKFSLDKDSDDEEVKTIDMEV